MANLTSADVVIDRSYEIGDRSGKVQGVRRFVTLTLVAQGDGGSGSDIPIAAFVGLTKITAASVFVQSDNSVCIVASPNAAGTSLLLKAAATNAPDVYSGTFSGFIEGY